MKKKLLIFLICIIVIILVIFVCKKIINPGGNIKKVNIIEKNSEIYSKKDIEDAISVTLKYFKKYYNDCTMKEITYIGDDRNEGYQEEWKKRYNKEDVIVLLSDFETGPSCGIVLNKNSKYERYNWILVRNKNEKWEHVDHGY